MKRNRNKLHRAHRQYLAVAVGIDLYHLIVLLKVKLHRPHRQNLAVPVAIDLHHLVVLLEVELHMATVAKTHKQLNQSLTLS